MPKERDAMRARSGRAGCDAENLVVHGVLVGRKQRSYARKIYGNRLDLFALHSYLRVINSISITVSWRPQEQSGTNLQLIFLLNARHIYSQCLVREISFQVHPLPYKGRNHLRPVFHSGNI